MSEPIEFPSQNPKGNCPGYLNKPSTPTTMGLVVIQEWWGVNEQHKQKAIKISNELGAITLVPDLYRGKVAIDREEAGHLMQGLDFKGAVADIHGAAKYLKEQLGCKKVGVTGFCMGGALTLFSLVQGDEIIIDSGSAFYGIPNSNYVDLTQIKVPVIGHFGELDDAKGFSDIETARDLNNKLKEAGVDFTLYEYKGCGHAFANEQGPHYNEESANIAFDRMYDFFRKTLQ
ncbi:hypothetical protein ABK040_010687 [Willaertia magna]